MTDTVMKNADEIYEVKRFPKSPARVVHSGVVLLQRALQGPAFTAFHPSQSQIQSQMPRLSWPQKGFAVSNTPKKEYSEIVSRVTALLGENPNCKAGKRNSFCDWEAFMVLSSQWNTKPKNPCMNMWETTPGSPMLASCKLRELWIVPVLKINK